MIKFSKNNYRRRDRKWKSRPLILKKDQINEISTVATSDGSLTDYID